MSLHPGMLQALSCDQECSRFFPGTALRAAPAGGVAQGEDLSALGSVSLFPTPPILCWQYLSDARSCITAPPGASPLPWANTALLNECLHSSGSAINPRAAASPERVLLQLLHSPARPRAEGEAGAHPGHPNPHPHRAFAQVKVGKSLLKSQAAFLAACTPQGRGRWAQGAQLGSARLGSAQLLPSVPIQPPRDAPGEAPAQPRIPAAPSPGAKPFIKAHKQLGC